ncbi:co-chaperone GroES [uncultured Clostridium sp.]|uniref:co-chaperone GroES n=1 Tax=uncultured Clostridium sp. TaxID=59620 RepID=UPI0026F08EC2|nr:co-chaperone GroES [uncultured Clostridium sp.]
MVLKPIYDRIVLKMLDIQEVKSSAGLVYQKDMSQSKYTTLVGEVVAAGEGRLLSDGTLKPLIVKVGDKVIVSKHQGESYNDGTNDYTILSESAVLSIIEEE